MHRSRIGGLFIDHPASSFDASVQFWLGATAGRLDPPSDLEDPYRPLGRFGGDLLVCLQRVGDGTAPRMHIDVDTDDVEAEVARLEALGAQRLQRSDSGRFWQMTDPGGVVFCVIPPHTDDFAERARAWRG